MPIIGPGGARRRGRRRGLVVGAAVGSAAARRNRANQQDEVAVPQGSSTEDQMGQLEKLGQLKKEGILTEEEFQAKKTQILGL
jgi:hypothetical protein